MARRYGRALVGQRCHCAASSARGARLLFLPAYSPDLNPIEQAHYAST
ncbi:MAG TPA: hypothetical protein VK970_09770 [Candidatus Methylacidiphilales bacterium]|nr:hypothetical protein [Candidatus Methylacidiphilales bacterium]